MLHLLIFAFKSSTDDGGPLFSGNFGEGLDGGLSFAFYSYIYNF